MTLRVPPGEWSEANELLAPFRLLHGIECDILPDGRMDFPDDLLAELKQPAQALKEYEASLQREPNRFNTFYGAARAAELSGDQTKAKAFYTKVVELGGQADGERASLVAARAFVAKH